MSNTDYRTLNIYRSPIYQKRVLGIDTHPSNSHLRSSSPKRSVLASRRRHSTPPASNKHSVDVNTSPSSTFLKYYHSHPRAACLRKEVYSPVDSVKTPVRPISLAKLRHQEERAIWIVTTPTSVKSFTDVVLPIAKKNRNIIVGTPSSLPAEIQSNNRSISTAKRGQTTSLNLEHDLSVSGANSYDQPLRDNTTKLKSIRWCHTKRSGRFPYCNLSQWYCKCPFFCWVACFFFALAIFTGLFLSIRILFD